MQLYLLICRPEQEEKKGKGKEKCTPFIDGSGSLLRRQLGAPEQEARKDSKRYAFMQAMLLRDHQSLSQGYNHKVIAASTGGGPNLRGVSPILS